MAIEAPLTAGHTFAETDELTAALLNKAFELAKANVPTPISVANGGTGATGAADARTALGLAIGTNVQAYHAFLAAIAAMTPTDSTFVVGNGTTFVSEDAATARTSLGLGTCAVESTMPIAKGGTGQTTKKAARHALGAVGVASAWITHAQKNSNVVLDQLPDYFVILEFGLDVQQAFNGSGTDFVRLGFSLDEDAIFTNTDVATTGLKSPVAGVKADGRYQVLGNDTTLVSYSDAGGDSTTGKALVWVKFIEVAVMP